MHKNLEEIRNKDKIIEEKDEEILGLMKKIEEISEEMEKLKEHSENEIKALNENKLDLNDYIKAKQQELNLLSTQKDQQNVEIQKLKEE